MTQEDKELLLKDLCARLPYNPMVKIGSNPNAFKLSQRIAWNWFYGKVEDLFDNCKPYLRPMSSMTEIELEKCRATCKNRPVGKSVLEYATINTFDWLNSHHFDYRNLIEKNLALEAPEGMYNLNKE